jgi:hypothetical protein
MADEARLTANRMTPLQREQQYYRAYVPEAAPRPFPFFRPPQVVVDRAPPPPRYARPSPIMPVMGSGRSDGRSARAAIVRKVMQEQGLKLIDASRYVKEHGLY